jgi:uncharacterized protein (DUF1810 family)
MENINTLERFIAAQQDVYEKALSEIKKSRKTSHWMWFIFPQVQGLGMSETSRFYAIADLKEAEAYLKHPLLGQRLISICTELMNQPVQDAHTIFGSPDDLKLKSSLTLFSAVSNAHPLFESLLKKFFGGEKDRRTLQILQAG